MAEGDGDNQVTKGVDQEQVCTAKAVETKGGGGTSYVYVSYTTVLHAALGSLRQNVRCSEMRFATRLRTKC